MSSHYIDYVTPLHGLCREWKKCVNWFSEQSRTLLTTSTLNYHPTPPTFSYPYLPSRITAQASVLFLRIPTLLLCLCNQLKFKTLPGILQPMWWGGDTAWLRIITLPGCVLYPSHNPCHAHYTSHVVPITLLVSCPSHCSCRYLLNAQTCHLHLCLLLREECVGAVCTYSRSSGVKTWPVTWVVVLTTWPM